MAKGACVGVESETIPVARELAAGATATGTKRVPLPATAWHPDIGNESMEIVPAAPRHASLEILEDPDRG